VDAKHIEAGVRRQRTVKLPDGTSIELGALTIGDFAQIREQACTEYKRNLIQTWTKNADLLPPDQRMPAIERAFARAEELTPEDLPPRKVWLPKRENDGSAVRHKGDRFFHQGAKVWIEKGGPVLEEQEVDYVTWWMSQTATGRLHASWLSMRHCPGQESMTYDQACDLLSKQSQTLASVADEIGDLSRPTLGNGDPAEASAGTTIASQRAELTGRS
jgi:hypothetical protein